jgi:UDP-GlcNAc:undecaprenyl-phosphate/decaprenyl-phosphate GlcNAc-1-phosphate transferase
LFLIPAIYFSLFLTSALLSLALTYRVRNCAVSRGFVVQPAEDRHIHTASVPRLGGIAIFISFMLAAAVALLLPKSSGFALTLPRTTVASIFAASLIIFLLGLYDDVRGAKPFLKFGIQSAAATILYFGGIGVNQFDLLSAGRSLHTAIALPLTVLWVVLITNAFNLIDGLDGLAAGSAFFSTLVVFVASLLVPNSTLALLAIVLAGSILGFLRFNFHPATIFLGDSGSMFIGFALAALALAGSQKAPTMIAVAIPVLSFGLPILDVCLAVSRRFVGGKPLFAADRDHIHHKLLKRGMSQRGAVTVLYGVTAVFALLSLIVMHDAALVALALTIIGLGVALGVQYLGYPEFSELQQLVGRAAMKKRYVANNVAVRHATAALNDCTDLVVLLGILRNVLQLVGFDSCRLGNYVGRFHASAAGSSFIDKDNGAIRLHWADKSTAGNSWSLRLELATGTHRNIGYLQLVRSSPERPLLLDINLLSRDFVAALSAALVRIDETSTVSLTRIVSAKSVRVKVASNASD